MISSFLKGDTRGDVSPPHLCELIPGVSIFRKNAKKSFEFLIRRIETETNAHTCVIGFSGTDHKILHCISVYA